MRRRRNNGDSLIKLALLANIYSDQWCIKILATNSEHFHRLIMQMAETLDLLFYSFSAGRAFIKSRRRFEHTIHIGVSCQVLFRLGC